MSLCVTFHGVASAHGLWFAIFVSIHMPPAQNGSFYCPADAEATLDLPNNSLVGKASALCDFTQGWMKELVQFSKRFLESGTNESGKMWARLDQETRCGWKTLFQWIVHHFVGSFKILYFIFAELYWVEVNKFNPLTGQIFVWTGDDL